MARSRGGAWFCGENESPSAAHGRHGISHPALPSVSLPIREHAGVRRSSPPLALYYYTLVAVPAYRRYVSDPLGALSNHTKCALAVRR
eukprot:6209857-Pleurochrysis_carterae.AAC.2